jgi:hypothetical protein
MKISKNKRTRLEKMAAEATVDCYTESEMFAAWACVLNPRISEVGTKNNSFCPAKR